MQGNSFSESANRLKLALKSVQKSCIFSRHYCPLAPVPVSYRHTTFQRPRIASRDVVLGLPHNYTRSAERLAAASLLGGNLFVALDSTMSASHMRAVSAFAPLLGHRNVTARPVRNATVVRPARGARRLSVSCTATAGEGLKDKRIPVTVLTGFLGCV